MNLRPAAEVSREMDADQAAEVTRPVMVAAMLYDRLDRSYLCSTTAASFHGRFLLQSFALDSCLLLRLPFV